MEFRTILTPQPSQWKIGLDHSILTIGSCFADHLGGLLQQNKLSTMVNPFGSTYNPISIHKLLHQSISGQLPAQETYDANDDVQFNYDFHSSFSHRNRKTLEQRISNALREAEVFLASAQYLIITYGTAWVFERTSSHEVVANCHKMPQQLFQKKLLSQKQILEDFEQLLNELMEVNRELRIILTVSPVRHIKDTLELNAVSKSLLRLSCHTLATQHDQVEYFPAYELLLDDLRDYRYYASDMLHPSPVAIRYIWEKFQHTYLDDSTKDFMKKWHNLSQALEHRPFDSDSPSHQQFLRRTLQQLEELKAEVNVDKEIASVKAQIK